MKALKTTIPKFKKKLSKSSSKGVCYHQKEAKRRNINPPSIRQAEELRSRLEANHPSFIKHLLKSHVASCFWMGLPVPFCKMYLPEKDTYFILENQNGKKYRAKYLARKTALSGGWRGFSIAEELSEGDVLVFHLVKSNKFKVYIIRKTDWTGNDESCVMRNFPTEVVQSGVEVGSLEQTIETHRPSSLSVVAQDKDQTVLLSKDNPAAVDDSGFASSKAFLILIDDLLKKEYELPHNIKYRYYELCCSQNAVLHTHLLEGINPFLIAGCIIETVNVTVAIKSCELHTFKDESSIWGEKLKSLKLLGMEVGFMLSHLDNLRRITDDPEAAKYRKQYLNLLSDHATSESKIKNLESKLSGLMGIFRKRADEIEMLKSEIKNHESRFQEQVSAQW